MEKVVGIGGVFFRARAPEDLARWYTDHLGIDILEAVWQQCAGPTLFAPFQHTTDYFGDSDRQWMINFRVSNLDAIVNQLESRGVEVERRPEEWDSDIGKFARLYDPEGNPIELWEPGVHSALDGSGAHETSE